MVNFDNLGTKAGDENYPEIDEEWNDLAPKKKRVIETLIQHPEKQQKEIAEIADVNHTHVHTIIYSLPPEKLQEYRGDMVEELNIEAQPVDEGDYDEELDAITVSAPVEMFIDITIPRSDLSSAAARALREAAVNPGRIDITQEGTE